MRLRDASEPEIAEADILAVCAEGDDTIPRARRPAILSRPVRSATFPPPEADRADARTAEPTRSTPPPPVPTTAAWPKGVAQTESPFARRASYDEEALEALARASTTADEPLTTTMRSGSSAGDARRFPWLAAIGFMGAGAAISAALFFWIVPPAAPSAPPLLVESPGGQWAAAVEGAPVQAPIPATTAAPKRAQLLTFDERDAVEIADPSATIAHAAGGASSASAPIASAAATTGHHASARPRATAGLAPVTTPADVLANALGPDPAPPKEDKPPPPRSRHESFAEAQLRAAAR